MDDFLLAEQQSAEEKRIIMVDAETDAIQEKEQIHASTITESQKMDDI